MFILDTNIVSEYNRPGGPDAAVRRWLEGTVRESQYVSVITLAEIQMPSSARVWPTRRLEFHRDANDDAEGAVVVVGAAGGW